MCQEAEEHHPLFFFKSTATLFINIIVCINRFLKLTHDPTPNKIQSKESKNFILFAEPTFISINQDLGLFVRVLHSYSGLIFNVLFHQNPK